jgi:hypothetical protein
VVKQKKAEQKVNCPICGKLLTKRGLAGHMQWKHGKQPSAPLLASKAKPLVAAQRTMIAELQARLARLEKAKHYDKLTSGLTPEKLEHILQESRLLSAIRGDLEVKKQAHDDEAFLSDVNERISQYANWAGISTQEAGAKMADFIRKEQREEAWFAKHGDAFLAEVKRLVNQGK